MPTERASIDLLPTELIELICHWIHVDKRIMIEGVLKERKRSEGQRALGHRTQFSRTLARLSLASKRYRQIALPYLYSYITVGLYDMAQLPLFIGALCLNQDLRPLVKRIVVENMPPLLRVGTEAAGVYFNSAAAEFDLPPLKEWKINKCCDQCSLPQNRCGHYLRLMTLLFLLTPNLEYLGKLFPRQIFLNSADPKKKAAGSTAATSGLEYAFGSLQQLWVAAAQYITEKPRATAIIYSRQDLGLQLGMFLVPSLRTLRVRAAWLFRPLPADIQLDSLKEITLDTALLTSQGLISLTSTCKVLESFNFFSRGNSPVFPNKAAAHLTESGASQDLFEFIPEDIVPAFSHLKGTLRHLAINRWDGARGTADNSINFDSEDQEMYATWPNRMGNGKVIGLMKDFTVLETLKLDSTCLFHHPLNSQIPPALPADHLTERLPSSLRHLVLPGAPRQIIPALHALASASVSKEFPALQMVEVTCDGRDVQKREISTRREHFSRFLDDTYSKFISMEEWDSLEQEFAAAGVKLVHIDSGNTGCFARDLLVSDGLLEPVIERRE
jgi:hypothetical protein